MHWHKRNNRGKVIDLIPGWFPPVRGITCCRPCFASWSHFDRKKNRWIRYGKCDPDKGYCLICD